MVKLKLFLCTIVLISLACGVQTQLPQNQTSVSMDSSIDMTDNLPYVTAIPLREAVVCYAGMVEENEGLNVRSSAGTDNAVNQILYRLSDGILVTLTGREETPANSLHTWYEISTPANGWVSGRYLCSNGE